MAKVVTKPNVNRLGHVGGIQKVTEGGQEQQGAGLLLEAFLEAVSLELLFRDKRGMWLLEGQGLQLERNSLCSSSSPDVNF